MGPYGSIWAMGPYGSMGLTFAALFFKLGASPKFCFESIAADREFIHIYTYIFITSFPILQIMIN